jgi:predicted esterase
LPPSRRSAAGGDPIVLLLADSRKSRALKSLPVWAFHGARDSVVKVGESERMVEAMRQMGAEEREADHLSRGRPRFVDRNLQ